MSVLTAINLDEFFPIVVLIFLLFFVGEQMIQRESETHWWARRIAAGAFILYELAALRTWPPKSAWDAVAITLRAILAGGLALSISTIALPAMVYVHRNTVGIVVEAVRRQEAERRRKKAEKEQAIANEKAYQRHQEDLKREAEAKEQERREQAEREERERLEKERANPPPPPPPTREEIAGRAKDGYLSTVKWINVAALDEDERKAAMLKAKQQYLRELNRAIS